MAAGLPPAVMTKLAVAAGTWLGWLAFWWKRLDAIMGESVLLSWLQAATHSHSPAKHMGLIQELHVDAIAASCVVVDDPFSPGKPKNGMGSQRNCHFRAAVKRPSYAMQLSNLKEHIGSCILMSFTTLADTLCPPPPPSPPRPRGVRANWISRLPNRFMPEYNVTIFKNPHQPEIMKTSEHIH